MNAGTNGPSEQQYCKLYHIRWTVQEKLMSKHPIFESKRLRCSRWEDTDFNEIFSLYSNAEAMRFVDDGCPISEELCQKWLRVTYDNYCKRGYGMFQLRLKEPPCHFVGCIGLVHPAGLPGPELKYAFCPEYWGRGLATEAVQMLVSEANQQFGLREVIATVHPDNARSQRVLEKSGFVEVQPRLNGDGTETLVYERSLGCSH